VAARSILAARNSGKNRSEAANPQSAIRSGNPQSAIPIFNPQSAITKSAICNLHSAISSNSSIHLKLFIPANRLSL
jgi:hypothetical protein